VVPTANSQINFLLFASNITPTAATTSDPSHIDLLKNTDPNTPTLVNANIYQRFIITAWWSDPTATINAALWT